jgi:chromosome segregation and condensation protein ScpB
MFLEKLGLQSLEELPSLAPLLPELDEVTTDSVSS